MLFSNFEPVSTHIAQTVCCQSLTLFCGAYILLELSALAVVAAELTAKTRSVLRVVCISAITTTKLLPFLTAIFISRADQSTTTDFQAATSTQDFHRGQSRSSFG
ncbi:uncharacterized protein C8R40DRAFT_1101575 [Lentinula edodes]|uniref:uncharacterized protein n=1 Tax=Lentinula edodes TaxID=5353 RepID=UPI001E8DDB88|nr:uncharacterized protein C8R40DRAFT_1101575 [Lentinula edodes]KAH7875865.1 hypothetical protein C8R40DRAFT_1101575 [Lentinula edodes]